MKTDCPVRSRDEEERMERENQEYWTRVRALYADVPPPSKLVRSTNEPLTVLEEPNTSPEVQATVEENDALPATIFPAWKPLTRHDTSIGGWVAERAV
jgi:hypothetical protein